MNVPVHTCFDPLLDSDATERSLTALLRTESRDAAINGLEAAVLVVAVLLWRGTLPWLVAASAAGAVVLGALLHQLVFAASVLGLRAWHGGGADGR